MEKFYFKRPFDMLLCRVVLVDVNGSVSKLSIAECEELEGGNIPDCLVLVYSIDDHKSFGKYEPEKNTNFEPSFHILFCFLHSASAHLLKFKTI